MTSPLKLGMIGLSPGNGHPYSWGAIFNGYDVNEMSSCPFPVIPQYLSQQSFPQDAIADATVSHIWTQDRDISNHVAKSAYIEAVVDDLEDMIEHVDGILLARDDSETHYEFAKPFLEAGLPIYIDKPLATTVAEAEKIYSLQQFEGQIFTCSALRYAPDFQWQENERDDLGKKIVLIERLLEAHPERTYYRGLLAQCLR